MVHENRKGMQLFLLGASCGVLLFGPVAALAETSTNEGELAEVVVTAQRRAENLQSVPLSISAISADSLSEHGIEDIYGLKSLTPNLDITHNNGEVKVFIRGIGKTLDNAGAEGSVAVHQDGIVLSTPAIQNTAFYDIERVEVLRGPQGTLYGRNATGGAVNVITRGPTEDLKFDARLSLGNYSSREGEFGVGGAIVPDKLLGRLAAVKTDRDGFGVNIFNGQQIDDRHEYGVRGKLKFLATDNLTAELQADYWHADDAASVVHTFGSAFGTLLGVVEGGHASPNVRDISSEAPQSRRAKTYGVALDVNYKVNSDWMIRSLTGYRDHDFVLRSDFDGTDVPGWPATLINTGHQFSQELQLNRDSQRLHSVFGLYYFDESIYATDTVPFGFASDLPGDIFDERGFAYSEAYAVFGSVTWAATPKLNLTAGVRYSDEKRHTIGSFQIKVQPFVDAFIPLEAKRSWSAITPRFSVDYTFVDDVMAYFTASKGFKSGQILPGNTSPPVNPEFLWSYEVGLKSLILHRKLRANLTAFYYDYKDLQVSQLRGLDFTITNAAKAKVKGFEAELTYEPRKSTTLDLTYGFLDSKFTEFLTEDPIFPQLGVLNLAGNPLPSAPRNMITLGASQSFTTGIGEFELRADWRWKDDAYYDPYKRASAFQAAYSEASVRGTFRPSGHPEWSIAIWANNLADKDAITQNYVSLASGGFPRNGSKNDPRTYGIEFRYNRGNE